MGDVSVDPTLDRARNPHPNPNPNPNPNRYPNRYPTATPNQVGWPLWETEMHDILKAAFPELQARYLAITPRGFRRAAGALPPTLLRAWGAQGLRLALTPGPSLSPSPSPSPTPALTLTLPLPLTLQSIFLYYCGSSIAGSASMSSATRIGNPNPSPDPSPDPNPDPNPSPDPNLVRSSRTCYRPSRSHPPECRDACAVVVVVKYRRV